MSMLQRLAATASLHALAGLAAPPTAALAPELAAAVERARRGAAELGVHVVELDGSAEVYGWRPDERLIVASNAKLVTTAAALDHLGPGFQFETPLLFKGLVAGERLLGDLGVIGVGDPNISGRHFEGDPLAVFRRWARRLAERGMTRVEGDLYLEHGRFTGPLVHPDWPRDQLSRWYEAPVAALSFSDNCVLVRVGPGAAPGKPVEVEVAPDLPIFDLRVEALTSSSSRRHLIDVTRLPGTNRLVVSGRFYRGAAPLEVWVTVNDPVEYFGAALAEALRQEGVTLDGEVRSVARLPPGPWRLLAEHRSDLLTTLEVTNRRSQNFYAESLAKLLGLRLCGEGSWEGARRALAAFLERVGLAPDDYRLADGSGMSRDNRFSARHLTRLLEYMHRHRWSREFLESLPYGGYEEHRRWKTRLAEPPYAGNVHAKTGSLRAVSTLSGYARARSGKTYAFSVLANGVGSAWEARRAQDAIVRAVVDHG